MVFTGKRKNIHEIVIELKRPRRIELINDLHFE